MELELPPILLYLVTAITVILFIQTALLLVFIVAAIRYFKKTEALLEELKRSSEPVLQAARELVVETRERVQNVAQNVVEVTQLAKNQMARVDSFLGDAGERARLQLVRIDDLLTDTVQKVEQTTDSIQQSVLAPIREISAVLAGARSALDVLFRRNKKGVDRVTQDEELFI